MNFSWGELSKKKIFSVLAPMEDVTDTVFRQLLLRIGRPDIWFTEFTNMEGWFSPGEEKVGMRFRYSEIEKPLIAQIWGLNPKLYNLGAQKLKLLGFDGIDINMGCPKDNVIDSGACAGLINNKPLAKELYLAAKEGADGLPVSIKTRIGFNEIDIEGWIGYLLKLKPDALTIHLRTVKEMSLVPPHFEVMEEIVKLRDNFSPNTILICNGDIESIKQGEKLCKESGFNGYMIGRGIFKNPYLFDQRDFSTVSTKEKFQLLKSHIELFDLIWGDKKNFDVLKKYFKIYVSDFEGAAELRGKLMETKSATQALLVIDSFGVL